MIFRPIEEKGYVTFSRLFRDAYTEYSKFLGLERPKKFTNEQKGFRARNGR